MNKEEGLNHMNNNKYNNNKFKIGQIYHPQQMNNNNLYIPFKFNNNMNNALNNNMFIPNMMANNSNFGINYGNGNNMNNFIKFQKNNMNSNDNSPNGAATMMFNLNINNK